MNHLSADCIKLCAIDTRTPERARVLNQTEMRNVALELPDEFFCPRDAHRLARALLAAVNGPLQTVQAWAR